jgi:hypothetical protein
VSLLLSDKRGQFAYFDAQLNRPDWRAARVLDFGGNRGNLLADSGGAIEPSRYWSVDVLPEAIADGRRHHPDAHFVHFDRWHYRYNPRGAFRQPLPHLGRFDFILAYSVFTMVDEGELVELAAALRAQLASRGALAFTFVDPHHRQRRNGRLMSNLEWRLDVVGLPSPRLAPDVDCCYLIEQRWIEPSPRLSFETLITASRVRALFPACEILPPTGDVRHHCCIIRS